MAQAFAADAVGGAGCLTALDKAVAEKDEVFVLGGGGFGVVKEDDAHAADAVDGDVVLLLFVADVDGVGGLDVGESPLSFLVAAGAEVGVGGPDFGAFEGLSLRVLDDAVEWLGGGGDDDCCSGGEGEDGA